MKNTINIISNSITSYDKALKRYKSLNNTVENEKARKIYDIIINMCEDFIARLLIIQTSINKEKLIYEESVSKYYLQKYSIPIQGADVLTESDLTEMKTLMLDVVKTYIENKAKHAKN